MKFWCFAITIASNQWLNATNVLVLICMLQYVVWATSFLLFKPASVTDYGKTIYGIISMLVFSQNFLITINNSVAIFKLIDRFENFMEKSKLFSIQSQKEPFSVFIREWSSFWKIIGQLIWFFDLIYIVITKYSIPGLMMPSFLITAVNYFVRDLGEESFYIPCPMMYVAN